jgi:MoaA/NifB/PqqE/SkfB family radical SAM enzyme
MEFQHLQDINFFTTYQCNSRCVNCHIWKNQEGGHGKTEMGKAELDRLAADPLFSTCGGFGLAGGEPVISGFFWRLLDFLPVERHITITTNALNHRRLADFLSAAQSRNRCLIQVSLDGIGPVNDSIRGVNGAYEKALALLNRLRELNVPRLISFTINRLNFNQLTDVYDLASSLGARFSARMAHCGGAYENKDSRELFDFKPDELTALDRALNAVIQTEMGKPGHRPASLVFLSKITDYYRGIQKDIPCRAMASGLVIDLYGDVFPNCPLMMQSLGNLHTQSLSDIWAGEKAQKARDRIRKFACGGCWNDCQVVANIEADTDFLHKEYTRLKTAFLAGRRMPDRIGFDEGGSDLLLSGWHGQEGREGFRYRWTGPDFSILVPQGTAGLEIFAGPAPGPGPILETRMEGHPPYHAAFQSDTWERHRILFEKPVETLTACIFKLDRSYCPLEAGAGSDGRNLGIAVHSIEFLSSVEQ